MTTPRTVIDTIRTSLGPDWTWNQVVLQLEDHSKLAALGFGDDDLNAIADAHTIATLGSGDRLALLQSMPEDPEKLQYAFLVVQSDLIDLDRLRPVVAALGLDAARIRLAAALRAATANLADPA